MNRKIAIVKIALLCCLILAVGHVFSVLMSGKGHTAEERTRFRLLSVLGFIEEYQKVYSTLPENITDLFIILGRAPNNVQFNDGWARPLVYRNMCDINKICSEFNRAGF